MTKLEPLNDFELRRLIVMLVRTHEKNCQREWVRAKCELAAKRAALDERERHVDMLEESLRSDPIPSAVAFEDRTLIARVNAEKAVEIALDVFDPPGEAIGTERKAQ